MRRVAASCYIPANALLLKLIRKFPQIRLAFSISGVTLEQMEEYAPEALESFKALARTGSVEFLAETYYHSLSCLIPGTEFELQVAKHQKRILADFGMVPRFFRNTELIYSNDTGERVAQMGFKGVITDGVDRVLNGLTPHQVFRHPTTPDLGILCRNYRLSDDIAFRFAQDHSKLTADRYMEWLNAIPADEKVVTLALDYETFGEHQKREAGIFAFLEDIFTRLARSPRFRFRTPSDALEVADLSTPLNVPGFMSWADEDRDLSAWLGNEMQRDAFDSVVRLENEVKNLLDQTLLRQWRALLTSDHFYYMSTKKGSDGEVHNYFSPYPSPYEAFINYMNVLTDFGLRLRIHKSVTQLSQKNGTEPWRASEAAPTIV